MLNKPFFILLGVISFIMNEETCVKCGKILVINEIHEDYTSYKCHNCGETVAIINKERFPHGI